MPKGKKKSTKGSQPSYYKLSEVVQKINNGQFVINSDVKKDAFQDFGWGIADIMNAYLKLEPKHFFKSDTSKVKPGIIIDVYKAHLMGENVYTHFYIDYQIGKLIINSLKNQ